MSAPFRLNRTLIRVAGPDTVGFLDNLLTQKISTEAPVRYAALLSPQGKVIADMFVWRDGEGRLLDVDASRSGDLLRRLNMYKLRASVSIDLLPGAVLAHEAPFSNSVVDPRLADLGYRALTNDATAGAPDEGGYRARRIAAGAPDLAVDAQPEEVFALEALLEELNGVDFQKGCFVGQENVSRMKRRATTRKKFCPIVFEGDPPPHGAPILAGEAELGSVRSGVSGRAIALLRLDRANEARDKGQQLLADGKPVRLDPPDWLLLPQRDD
jgi:folate-binding protein YgfZ